jgi:hypothetical protein
MFSASIPRKRSYTRAPSSIYIPLYIDLATAPFRRSAPITDISYFTNAFDFIYKLLDFT